MGIAFNGSSQTLAWSGNLKSTLPISIFVWARALTSPGVAFGAGQVGVSSKVQINVNSAGTVEGTYAVSGNYQNIGNQSITGAWQPTLLTRSAAGLLKVYVGAATTTPATDTYAIGDSLSGFNLVTIGGNPVVANGANTYFSGDLAEAAVWSTELSSTEWDLLRAGGKPETVSAGTLIEAWSLLNSSSLTGVNGRTFTAYGAPVTSGSHPITRAVAPTLSGTVVADDFVSAGGFSSVTPGTLSGNVTLADFIIAGILGQQPGVITTPPLKNNAGTLLVNLTGVIVNVYSVTTGNLVAKQSGLTSNGSGVVSIVDAALTPGTSYTYEVDLTSSSLGRRLPIGIAA
jgi:hypothetical protein